MLDSLPAEKHQPDPPVTIPNRRGSFIRSGRRKHNTRDSGISVVDTGVLNEKLFVMPFQCRGSRPSCEFTQLGTSELKSCSPTSPADKCHLHRMSKPHESHALPLLSSPFFILFSSGCLSMSPSIFRRTVRDDVVNYVRRVVLR